MRRRKLVDFQKLPPLGHRLAGGPPILPLRAAIQRDPGLLSKLLQRFPEIQPVDLSIKIKQIAGRLTAETVEKTFFLVDGKRGLCFLVKRTGSDPARPVALEVHVAPGDVDEIQARLDFLNGTCVPSHTLPSGGQGCRLGLCPGDRCGGKIPPAPHPAAGPRPRGLCKLSWARPRPFTYKTGTAAVKPLSLFYNFKSGKRAAKRMAAPLRAPFPPPPDYLNVTIVTPSPP